MTNPYEAKARQGEMREMPGRLFAKTYTDLTRDLSLPRGNPLDKSITTTKRVSQMASRSVTGSQSSDALESRGNKSKTPISFKPKLDLARESETFSRTSKASPAAPVVISDDDDELHSNFNIIKNAPSSISIVNTAKHNNDNDELIEANELVMTRNSALSGVPTDASATPVAQSPILMPHPTKKTSAKINLSAQKVKPIPRHIVEPVIQPWALDLFTQSLDLLSLDAQGGSDLVKALVKDFTSEIWIKHRNVKETKLCNAQELRDFSLDEELIWKSKEQSLIQEYVHFLTQNDNPIQFQPAILICLAGILATPPQRVFRFWMDEGGPEECRKEQTMPEVIEIDVDDCDHHPIHNVNNTVTNPPDKIPEDLPNILESLDMMQTSLAFLAQPTSKYIDTIAQAHLTPATCMDLDADNAFENAVPEYYAFERLWSFAKPPPSAPTNCNIIPSDTQILPPERRFGAKRLVSKATRFLLSTIDPLSATLTTGCTCTPPSTEDDDPCCFNTKCLCVKAMKGPAYQHDALRDKIQTIVIECGDACSCTASPYSKSSSTAICSNSSFGTFDRLGEEFSPTYNGFENESNATAAPPFRIAPSKGGSGFGLFANHEMHHGMFVGEYCGHVVGPNGVRVRRIVAQVVNDEGERMVREQGLFVVRRDGIELFGIDAMYSCDYTRFINHSCKPNCRAVLIYQRNKIPTLPRVAIFALHTIKADSELSINYADLDVGGPEYSGKCLCSIKSKDGKDVKCSGVVPKRKRIAYAAEVTTAKKKRTLKKK